MSETVLKGKRLHVDRRRVGISYSGGGPLLLVELGIAQACVELGIRPAAVAGVSAGSIAATAHAIDVERGEGIRLAASSLLRVSDHTLGLTLPQIALNAVWHLRHLAALGDNEPIKDLLAAAFQQLAQSPQLEVGYFTGAAHPKLILGATDRLSGRPEWFQGAADVSEALVASSAIPGVFPARKITLDGQDRLFIDGGVVSNQPISVLALEGCGTIYACAVGYDGEALLAPANLVDNFQQAISIMMHQASRLEQDYVQCRMGDAGVIHHIHPEVAFTVKGFDFTADAIAEVMDGARQATKSWITENHLLPGETGSPAGDAAGAGTPTGPSGG